MIDDRYCVRGAAGNAGYAALAGNEVEKRLLPRPQAAGRSLDFNRYEATCAAQHRDYVWRARPAEAHKPAVFAGQSAGIQAVDERQPLVAPQGGEDFGQRERFFHNHSIHEV